MSIYRRPRPGGDIEAYCTRCKRGFTHTILTMATEDLAERVRCNTCGSEHRYIPERNAPRTPRSPSEPSAAPPRAPRTREVADMEPEELIDALRDLVSSAGSNASTPIGAKWEGGTLILRPGKPGLADKEVSIEAFFRKIVMLRDRLRVLEQQVNSNDKLADADKIAMQQYITRCYGSLTTFNVLFDDREDWFVGEKKSE